jgi:hypothetical protein
MNNNDDRPDCITASELDRVYACPGYPNRKREVNPPRSDGGEDAQMGTRCHSGYAGEPVEYMNDDEEGAVSRAVAATNSLAESLGFDLIPITERRLFAGSTFSGKPDRIYIKGTRAFITDAKFGRIKVEDTSTNKQIRGYVALVAYNWPELTEITVATIQPWFGGEPSVTVYGINEIQDALHEVFGAIARTINPDAPRIPGDHCKYCPLSGVSCQESAQWSITPPVDMPARLSATGTAFALSNVSLAKYLNHAIIAEGIIEAVREEARRRLDADPCSIPGWELQPGRVTEKITDPEAVFARASLLGVSQKSFLESVSIGKEKLTSIVKSATGLKGRELDIMIDSITTGATSAKTSRKILSKKI